MTSIEIREYTDQDQTEVLEVLRSALGETALLRRTAELWAWKHELNPFGRSLALVAVSGTKIVGVRAFMRWELITPTGETVRCVRAVDTATHPDFQRKGIFRNLTLTGVDLARSEGVQLVFNTPNPKSLAGYLKMGWREVGKIGVLVRPSLRMLRRSDAPPETEYLRNEKQYLRNEDPIFAGISDRPPLGLRTPRSEPYLTWRYQRHPTARYSPIGVDGTTAFLRSNVRSGRRELVVSDVIGAAARPAYKKVIEKSTADYVVAWHNKRSPERRAAISVGLLPVPRLKVLTLVANPLLDVPEASAGLDSWDLSLGDLELL
ncbi:MAG TPA: GNAT family N-acetyltransferase [Acidimicrobiia bacterium]|nr:GNAT family N-acetyltransferase [Acidimicrobiia bacterium]